MFFPKKMLKILRAMNSKPLTLEIVRRKIAEIIKPCVKNRLRHCYFVLNGNYFRMIFHCTTTKVCKVEWQVCVYKTEIVVERSNSPHYDEDLG